VGNGGTEWSRLRSFGIDVNPLVVEGRVGEFVDLVLRDRDPIGHAEVGTDGAEKILWRGEVRRHGRDAIRLRFADVDASLMAGDFRSVAPEGESVGADVEPLHVRAPEVVRAFADAVAILGPDHLPRIMLGRLGAYVGFGHLDDLSARIADWVHQDDLPLVLDALTRSRRSPGVEVDVRVRVHNEHDGWHDMTLVFRNLLDNPDVQGTIVRATDQTVFDREARWRTLVGESPIGIFEVDLDDRCTLVNPAFERLTGLSAHEALGHGWLSVIASDDVVRLREQQRVASNAGRGETTPACELRIVLPEGASRWVSLRSVPLRQPDGRVTAFLGTLEDVTERKGLEERLEHDATHDRLTGLGSRALLVEEMTAALARTRRGGPGIALLFIDLDGFKRVNDMLGHAAGDELLVQVAKRLRAALRGGDLCVRLGGDEFVVCCPEEVSSAGGSGQSSGDAAHAHALQLAERLLEALSEPYDVHGHEMLVGASIGIAGTSGEDPVSIDQLLSNADIAAYRAKRLGRGRIEMFDDQLRRQLAKARRVARSVGRLLDQPRLPILCSALVHLGDRNVVGFDCTVDWETAGVRESIDTIARSIDDAGMSRALDVALVRTLLAHIADWERRPPAAIVPGLSMTLTRTGALSPVLPELVRDMLVRSDVTPSLCWLGVPESAVAHDLETSSRVAVALDELGVGVALRDFGSAVSSLEQLRRLPAPTMTIAGPLVAAVRNAGEDSDPSATLLAAIVKYACALGRIVVAIDVQDEAHAQRLRELGCDFGTGPAFGGSIRPEQVEDFLARPV
jgi:diguanylate cyclase (GGDEF)-like protein/PAS domain S-box-containing protein